MVAVEGISNPWSISSRSLDVWKFAKALSSATAFTGLTTVPIGF